jgi:hypothetical protein
MSAAECFNKYNAQYLSDVGTLYIIQDQPTLWNNTYRWTYNATTTDWLDIPSTSKPSFYPSNGWMCPSRNASTCDVSNQTQVPQNRSEWKPYDSTIRYCLAGLVEERRKLQLSFTIAIVIVLSNFIKAICMALTLYNQRP